MREITHIAIHCTGASQQQTVESILRYWREVKKWKNPGYHYLTEASGKRHNLHPIEKPANGIAGFNANVIHMAYIGGVDNMGVPIDNRTPEQISDQIDLVRDLKAQFPNAIVQGHRDFLGVTKACPSFDVKEWLIRDNVLDTNITRVQAALFILQSHEESKYTIEHSQGKTTITITDGV